MAAVTVYSSGFSPDPSSAREVLAFVLTRPEILAPGGEPEELDAVRSVLDAAKEEAVRRWEGLRSGPFN